jgi:hypothetical protein
MIGIPDAKTVAGYVALLQRSTAVMEEHTKALREHTAELALFRDAARGLTAAVKTLPGAGLREAAA